MRFSVSLIDYLRLGPYVSARLQHLVHRRDTHHPRWCFEFYADVYKGRIKHGDRVILKDFYVSEWIPRIPGGLALSVLRSMMDYRTYVRLPSDGILTRTVIRESIDVPPVGSVSLPIPRDRERRIALGAVTDEEYCTDLGIVLSVDPSVYSCFKKIQQGDQAVKATIEAFVDMGAGPEFPAICPPSADVGPLVRGLMNSWADPPCILRVESSLQVSLAAHETHPKVTAWMLRRLEHSQTAADERPTRHTEFDFVANSMTDGSLPEVMRHLETYSKCEFPSEILGSQTGIPSIAGLKRHLQAHLMPDTRFSIDQIIALTEFNGRRRFVQPVFPLQIDPGKYRLADWRRLREYVDDLQGIEQGVSKAHQTSNADFHCPVCGGTGIEPGARPDPRTGHVACSRCSASATINSDGTQEIRVQGTNAHEVQSVFCHGLAAMAGGGAPMAGVGGVAGQPAETRKERGEMAETSQPSTGANTTRPKPTIRPVLEQASEQNRADVALITALPSELDAVVKHLSAHTQVYSVKEGARTYYHCTTNTGLKVVAGAALGMGQLNAALLTRDLITTWQPKKVLLIGFAAGIGDKVQLGDVVISEQIVDYELGKVTPDGTDTRWSVYRTDANLLDSALNFRDRTWVDEIAVARPDGDWQANPRIHTGVVLSGNKVIADADAAGALREVWSRAIALEMEAAGAAAAIYQSESGPQFIMIKGVCDRADVAKDDAWQEYAADVAAAFAATFVGFRMQAEDLRPSATAPTPAASPDPSLNEALFSVLTQAYDMGELKVLVFHLQEDWDEIPGDTKSLRVVNLIQYMQRRRKVDRLVERVKKERPDLLETYHTRGDRTTNP
jgi:nucleoside phosphorylase